MDSLTSSSSETTRAPLKLRRKPHRKSRNGCARCKRRRIKCDEIKPGCTNCTDFGIECDYNVATPSTGNLILMRPKFVHTQGLPGPKQRGRPRTIWGDEIPIPSSSENDSLSLRRSQRFFPETQDQVDNFRLLNHFITRAIDCPGPNAPRNIRDPLHDQALLLSFTHPCILHLIQEFSALELARQQPLKQEHYRTLAERHATKGLQGATALLSQFTTSSYHAAYTAATFACINYFARGPQPGEYLLFSLNGPSQWLPLLHGIRTIIDLVGIEKIAAGPAETVSQETPAMAESPAKALLAYPDLDWSDHLARLKAFVSSIPDSALDLDALNKLTWCYEATYGLEGVFKGDVNHQNAFIWPYQLDTEFTAQIQCGQPLSLIVAAHFALLLQNYEFTWYMVGWSDHVLTGIVQVIDQSYRGWLDWPITQARRIRMEKGSRRA